jgi:hypothetical protein
MSAIAARVRGSSPPALQATRLGRTRDAVWRDARATQEAWMELCSYAILVRKCV